MGFSAWWTIGLRGYLKSCNFFHWLHCTPKLKDTAFSIAVYIQDRLEMKLRPSKPLFHSYLIAKGTKNRDAPSAARKGGRMSSCNTKSGTMTGTKQDKPTRTSTKIKGVSCSCGQLCKNFRGLKLHQIKAKCQASENKLTGPDKRCFVSLTDILNTSFLKFGDTIYCKTPSNTFVPICNFNKPISVTQCFVETNDIVIDPIPEYFNDNISPCDSNACLTCNSFISNQSFKSNLTGRIYKTQTYEQLTCGSSNVVYAIHCVRCGLMYVGETGRSLRSRINGHRAGIIKDGQSLLYKHFRLAGHSVADMKVQIL